MRAIGSAGCCGWRMDDDTKFLNLADRPYGQIAACTLAGRSRCCTHAAGWPLQCTDGRVVRSHGRINSLGMLPTARATAPPAPTCHTHLLTRKGGFSRAWGCVPETPRRPQRALGSHRWRSPTLRSDARRGSVGPEPRALMAQTQEHDRLKMSSKATQQQTHGRTAATTSP